MCKVLFEFNSAPYKPSGIEQLLAAAPSRCQSRNIQFYKTEWMEFHSNVSTFSIELHITWLEARAVITPAGLNPIRFHVLYPIGIAQNKFLCSMLSALCLQLFVPTAAHMAYVIMRRYYCDAPLLFDTGWRGFSFPPNSFSRRASHVRVKFLSILRIHASNQC